MFVKDFFNSQYLHFKRVMFIGTNIVVEMSVAAYQMQKKEEGDSPCGDIKIPSNDVSIILVAVYDEFSLLHFKLEKQKMNIGSMIK